jgi:hypothetical protein
MRTNRHRDTFRQRSQTALALLGGAYHELTHLFPLAGDPDAARAQMTRVFLRLFACVADYVRHSTGMDLSHPRLAEYPGSAPDIEQCSAPGAQGGDGNAAQCPWQRHAKAATKLLKRAYLEFAPLLEFNEDLITEVTTVEEFRYVRDNIYTFARRHSGKDLRPPRRLT